MNKGSKGSKGSRSGSMSVIPSASSDGGATSGTSSAATSAVNSGGTSGDGTAPTSADSGDVAPAPTAPTPTAPAPTGPGPVPTAAPVEIPVVTDTPVEIPVATEAPTLPDGVTAAPVVPGTEAPTTLETVIPVEIKITYFVNAGETTEEETTEETPDETPEETPEDTPEETPEEVPDETAEPTEATTEAPEETPEETPEEELVPIGTYDDFDWAELPADVQEAATVLGYDENIWDIGLPAATDDLAWEELSPEQQAAAALFGYNEEIWDEEERRKARRNLRQTQRKTQVLEPTAEELDNLIESTYNFYIDVFTASFSNFDDLIGGAVTSMPVDVGYEITYTADATFASPAPTVDDVNAAITGIDFELYLNDFVQPSGDYFAQTFRVEVNGVGPGDTDPPLMTEAPTAATTEAPVETGAPTAAATEAEVVTTAPTGAATEGGVITTAPTASATEAPIVTGSPTVATIDPPLETGAPTAGTTDTPIATDSPTVATTEGPNETEAPETEAPIVPDETEVPSTDTPSTDAPETNVPSTDAPTTGTTDAVTTPGSDGPTECPTVIQQDGNMTYSFFFADREPSEDELAQLTNDTLRFFSDTYSVAFPGTFVSIDGSAVSTEFELNPPAQLHLGLTAQSTFAPCAPPLEQFQDAIDFADYEALWQEYIRPDVAEGSNIIVFVDNAEYNGTIAYV